MKQNYFSNTRAVGYSCFLSPKSLQKSIARLKRQMELSTISELCNKYEVVVLYRCLPSHAIKESNGTSYFIRVKEIISVFPTIFSDGSKDPLTIIGKLMSPLSFPHRLDTMSDLGLFKYGQKNAWKKQSFGELLAPASKRRINFKTVSSSSCWTTALLTRLNILYSIIFVKTFSPISQLQRYSMLIDVLIVP